MLGFFSTPAQAGENELEIDTCRFDVAGLDRHVLPSMVSVAFRSWGSTAVIDDPIIEKAVGNAIEGQIERSDATQVVIVWTYFLKPGAERKRPHSFRLTMWRGSDQAQISTGATLPSTGSKGPAEGRCKRVKR